MMNRYTPNHRPLFGIEAAGRCGPIQCSLRRALPRDVVELRALANRAAHHLCAADYTPSQIATVMRFGLAVDEQAIADRTCYVVETPDGIIAVGAWSFRAALVGNFHPDYEGDALDVLDPAVHPARLRGFFSHPCYARRGLGCTLAEMCERSAASAGFTSLELMTTPTGRRLFLACGFEDLEPVTHVFPNAVAAPAYRMIKSIDPATRRSPNGDQPCCN
jgi:hypothetical protein